MLWFFAPSHQPLRRSIVVDDTTLGSKERAGLWWWGLVKQGFLERYGAYSLHFEKGRGRKLEDDPFFLRWLFWKVLWYAMFASRVCIIYNQIIPFGDIYIYITNTFIGLPQGMHTMLWTTFLWVRTLIFFYPSSLWKHTTCVLKDMGLLPPEVLQTETSWAQLETTGSHWFPCSVGVNSFYIVYPDVVSGTFHPALKKQAGTPRSTSFHQRLGRLKGDLLLFCCLIVLMWGWSILGRCIENVGVDEMGWSSGSKIL